MNRTALKNYAPQARRAFIQAITDRAAYYGLAHNKTEPVVQKGDVAVIAGREHPRAVARERKQLEERIKRNGFEPTMEAIAYTWFNRLVAIRFMELHGYLEHGYRVLSHPDGKPTPEILEQAEHVALAGLNRDIVIDLKVAGNKEGELYRLLLTAQCNALHAAMPFLFERIDDETELLLPDNLLHSDSLIRRLVGEIDEGDWQQVEIIGWIYQFYISEKKSEVSGKVVASEDIPAATQLFTPNWIVKFLVQNTLGRQWLATYPLSNLRQKMEYYKETAEQTPEVLEQLKAVTPTSLNPEELTFLDPACGSGHILVEAYDLFKLIYQERGYRAKDIPALILEKNLFGLELDDRAAQLASFALMMKARADDRRIFEGDAKPRILAFEGSAGMDSEDIAHALNAPISKEDVPSEYLFEEIQEDKDGLFSKKALSEKGHISQADIGSLLELFKNAKTIGSLIQVPSKLAAKLPKIEQRLEEVLKHGDLTHAPARIIKPLILQAKLLASQFDAVVANPPYLGNNYFDPLLKDYAERHFDVMKADLFACFIEQCRLRSRPHRHLGLITLTNWMSQPTYEQFRRHLLGNVAIQSLVDNGRGVFGSDFGSCAFVMLNSPMMSFEGSYFRLFDKPGMVSSNLELQQRFLQKQPVIRLGSAFLNVPSIAIAYDLPVRILELFARYPAIDSLSELRAGIQTGDNDRFLRFWHEVDFGKIGFGYKDRAEAKGSLKKWFPHNKGGEYRRWFGNQQYVIDWEDDGAAIRQKKSADLASGRITKNNSKCWNQDYYFKNSITWTAVSISRVSFRTNGPGFLFDTVGQSLFPHDDQDISFFLGLLNSKVVTRVLGSLSPTVHFNSGTVARLPIYIEPRFQSSVHALAEQCVQIARDDWNSREESWEFRSCAVLLQKGLNLGQSHTTVSAQLLDRIRAMKELEEENNRLFIQAYGLQDELSPSVLDDQITLYPSNREEEIKRLLSYVVGCIMGRYSIDTPGLIYAGSGNQGFSASHYNSFRVDHDGIITLLQFDRGVQDDTSNRIVEFVGAVWPKEHLEENLKFIADSLGSIGNELPRETISRYLATGFYRHHLSVYKRRPIYWLFSSGKLRAFQCLVYLHRYHEGTLARMRTDYVIPLQGQIAARIEQLEADKAKSTSTSHRNKLQKEQTDLKKQQAELLVFEEKLKHAADQKITLDLDDGVKINYSKFGDLLAESRAITGGKDDD